MLDTDDDAPIIDVVHEAANHGSTAIDLLHVVADRGAGHAVREPISVDRESASWIG